MSDLYPNKTAGWFKGFFGIKPTPEKQQELDRQACETQTAVKAASDKPNVIQVMGLNVVLDLTMPPDTMKLVQPQAHITPHIDGTGTARGVLEAFNSDVQPKPTMIGRGFINDTWGRTIPTITITFNPDDFDTRDKWFDAHQATEPAAPEVNHG